MSLPKDPMILLSFVNTKLRDEFTDLEEFCKEEDISIESLKEQLESIGFQYNETIRQWGVLREDISFFWVSIIRIRKP